jgi:hypothetical protein
METITRKVKSKEDILKLFKDKGYYELEGDFEKDHFVFTNTMFDFSGKYIELRRDPSTHYPFMTLTKPYCGFIEDWLEPIEEEIDPLDYGVSSFVRNGVVKDEMCSFANSTAKNEVIMKIIKGRDNKEVKPEFTDKHYSFYYTLSKEEIKEGRIKVDPYKINKAWGLNSKDDTGGLFHILKTICRYGDKNSKEREIKAMEATLKRMKEEL